jgi:hypothetical protein
MRAGFANGDFNAMSQSREDDSEGRHWLFSQYTPDVSPEEWGAKKKGNGQWIIGDAD